MTDELDESERRNLRRKARAAVLDALDALGGRARREQIVEHALANGGFTERELAAKPPAKAPQYPSLAHHQLSWMLTNLKRRGLIDNPERGIWQLAGEDAEHVAAANTAAEAKDAEDIATVNTTADVECSVSEARRRELREMPYRAYLRTPEWQATRAAALRRAGHCCALNPAHEERLEVHHRTYERRGAERPEDLLVLCHDCHTLYHESSGLPRRSRDGRGSPETTSRPAPGKRSASKSSSGRAKRRHEPAPRGKRSLLRRLLGS